MGDAPDWQVDLGAVLGREGYATCHVARLDAVLSLLEDRPLAAVFLASGPLNASDLLLVRRIRDTAPRTAVVVVTRSTPTDPDLKRALETGATAFLSWPAATAAVRHVIDRGFVSPSAGSGSPTPGRTTP